jgi:hypothetical protein
MITNFFIDVRFTSNIDAIARLIAWLVEPTFTVVVEPSRGFFLGQLPTSWFEHMSWLKRTLLPTLAFPANARVRCLPFFAFILLLFKEDKG